MRYLKLSLMVAVVSAVNFTTGCAAAPEARDMFPSADFSGWKLVAETATDVATVCTRSHDGVVAVAGTPIGYLTTTATCENFQLHLEWRWPGQTGNGGVLLHIVSGPKDRQWPECFQIQLKHTRAGDVLPMAGATLAELPAPEAKQVDRRAESSEKPPGEWNVCDIVCRGDTIECTVNGVLQNRVTACKPAAGAIGFQLEGVPFELRHVRFTPLAP
jgi:hypothetical protein